MSTDPYTVKGDVHTATRRASAALPASARHIVHLSQAVDDGRSYGVELRTPETAGRPSSTHSPLGDPFSLGNNNSLRLDVQAGRCLSALFADTPFSPGGHDANSDTECQAPVSPLPMAELEIAPVPSLGCTPASGHRVPGSSDSEPNTCNRRNSREQRPSSVNVQQVNPADFHIVDGDMIEGNVEQIATVGKGRSSVVRFGVRTADGKPIAIKYIKPGMKDEVQRELSMLDIMTRQGAVGKPASLVQSIGFFRDLETLEVGIVMERMEGSLEVLRGRAVPEAAALAALAMTLQGLVTLHDDFRVIHRDIKPGNLLYDGDGRLKVSDFGLAVHVGDVGRAHLFVGSMLYMAPERLRGENYGFVSDVWSAAMMAAELMLGQHPLARVFPVAPEGRETTPETTFWAIAEVLKHADGDDNKVESAIDAVVAAPLRDLGVSASTIELLTKMLCRSTIRLTAAAALGEIHNSYDDAPATLRLVLQQQSVSSNSHDAS